MCFMDGQGVDVHVGDDFLCCFFVYLLPRWFQMVLTQSDSPCSALNVKVVRNSE